MLALFLINTDEYLYRLFVNLVDTKKFDMYGIISDVSSYDEHKFPIIHPYYIRETIPNKIILASENIHDISLHNKYIIIGKEHKKDRNLYYYNKSSINKNIMEILNDYKLFIDV